MDAKWICCQLGAREHYSVPRALHWYGVLELLFTDTWIRPRNPFGRLSSSLRQRFHADLEKANVCAPNFSSIALEVRAKLASFCGWSNGFSYWEERMVRNELFQKVAAERLSRIPSAGTPRVVMAYSYMALEVFRLARARGWRTVLGQIDAGPPEERIIARLHDENPVYGRSLQSPPPEYWSNWREECALADRIVVNSSWSRAALTEEGVPAGKIRVVPLAYEKQAIPEFQREYPVAFTPSRPLRVLFLGQITLRKGVGSLFDAIRLLREYPIEFWFVGPLQVLVPADLRENRQVRWIGPVSRGETARYYREADVFIFPTFSDGFGLTQLEAQSWNLPIIATNFCGEVVKDGISGWILSQVSPATIAAILRRCLAEPALLQELSRRSILSERFSLAQVGNQWLHVFD